jgi:hypothetical protein
VSEQLWTDQGIRDALCWLGDTDAAVHANTAMQLMRDEYERLAADLRRQLAEAQTEIARFDTILEAAMLALAEMQQI